MSTTSTEPVPQYGRGTTKDGSLVSSLKPDRAAWIARITAKLQQRKPRPVHFLDGNHY